jgi:hypothetical protein
MKQKPSPPWASCCLALLLGSACWWEATEGEADGPRSPGGNGGTSDAALPDHAVAGRAGDVSDVPQTAPDANPDVPLALEDALDRDADSGTSPGQSDAGDPTAPAGARWGLPC